MGNEALNVFWMALVFMSHGITQPLMYEDANEVSGYLSGYSDGVMSRTIDYYDNLNYVTWCGFGCRHKEQFDGYIVVAHCNRIGSIAQLHTDTGIYKVLVTDCIAQEHIVVGNIFDPTNGYIGEVDYDLFNRLGTRYGTLTY